MNPCGPQMPRMPWYPSSFFASTRTWPFVARAIYRELLDISWDAGGLPSDEEALQAMIGVTSDQWRVAWPFVKQKFVIDADGLLRNRRLEAHREKAIELSEKRRNAARERWEKQDNTIELEPERERRKSKETR